MEDDVEYIVRLTHQNALERPIGGFEKIECFLAIRSLNSRKTTVPDESREKLGCVSETFKEQRLFAQTHLSIQRIVIYT